MAGKNKDIQLLIERLKREGCHYRLIHKSDGTIEVEAQGAEDHTLARAIIESVGVMKRDALVQE
jgi:DNA-directed RNA polymerase subunit L